MSKIWMFILFYPVVSWLSFFSTRLVCLAWWNFEFYVWLGCILRKKPVSVVSMRFLFPQPCLSFSCNCLSWLILLLYNFMLMCLSFSCIKAHMLRLKRAARKRRLWLKFDQLHISSLVFLVVSTTWNIPFKSIRPHIRSRLTPIMCFDVR